ncbi:MAG: hypothetical protein JO202_00435 [Ktedonobacteraceae bacterium]|nr:hypothetical protein [Ktedonobacteraceae bacterium]
MKSFLPAITTGLVLINSFLLGGIASAHAASSPERLHYYGANLQRVVQATGVHLNGSVDPNAPWPQFAQNYCFIAVV